MNFNFDEVRSRRNTGSEKWNVGENELPMSMADMDFVVTPSILEAFSRRLEHGILGYAAMTEDWYDAYINWWKKRHNWTIRHDWLVYSAGVIPTLSSAVRKLSSPAEKVVVLTPSYNIFFNSIVNNGRFVSECPLLYQNGEYAIDFTVLEEKLSDPQASLMFLCNPHNPVGKIWSREELQKIALLAKKYSVIVVSDEIHCDLTDPGYKYTPFASVSEVAADISITCISPTKAFNLAGIQSSAVVAPNPTLRHRIWRGLNTDEVGEASIFGAMAPAAAFNGGEEWLDAVRQYIFENKQYVRAQLAEQLKDIHVVPSQATYLLWFDCRAISEDSTELANFIRKETGLILVNGAGYGAGGQGFLRMCLAYPRCEVEDGVERFIRGVKLFMEQK